MGILTYTREQAEYIAERDPLLGRCMEQITVSRNSFGDFFEGLCYNIVNQQLSMKACDTLWGKLTARLGDICPQSTRDSQRLRDCGLSRAKAECIARCSELFLSGTLSASRAAGMTDAELKKSLTQIRGIGEWTAEMTLIFCLERPDVLSLSDYGIRKGLSLLHGIDANDKRGMERFRALYSPFGTAASLCLWEIARMTPENVAEMSKGG